MVSEDPATVWKLTTVANWYGERERIVEIASERAVWYSTGLFAVLAVRARARLGQALSSAEHAEGYLQIVGVGEWNPTSIEPAWDTDPRLGQDEDSS